MSSYRERKAQRRDYYLRFVYGWKIRPCTACSGSGHYDGEGAPPCGGCEGTGTERYQGPKSPKD